MALPKGFTINHMTWAITRNDAECDALGSDGHVSVAGRTVTIRTDLAPDREREAMLHESLHACVAATTLVLEEEDEETLVNNLTGPLLDMLRSNPRLVAYLLHT